MPCFPHAFVLAAILASPPAPAPPGDSLGPFMSFQGVALEKTTLEEARARLGGPRAVFNGGDAHAGVCAQCYTGPDGTTLALVSHAEMGGCSIVNWYELVQKESLASYSGVDSFAVPDARRPRCAPLKGLSRTTLVGGRLKLGMTEAQIAKVMGAPGSRTSSRVTYSSEIPMQMTKEEELGLAGRGPWISARSVEVEFSDGRAVAITVSQVTSN